jgi:hypothetical protein
MARNSLIDLGYTLVLYLKQSIFSNPTIVKIPIYIGTIPILSSNETTSISSLELLTSRFSDYAYRHIFSLSNPRFHTPIHYIKDEDTNNPFKIKTYKGNGPFYPFYNFTN